MTVKEARRAGQPVIHNIISNNIHADRKIRITDNELDLLVSTREMLRMIQEHVSDYGGPLEIVLDYKLVPIEKVYRVVQKFIRVCY